MTNIIPFPEPVDTYFGVCPICKRHDGYLNLGAEHWFRCDRHKTKWRAGVNLFSSWQEETDASFADNAELLDSFREVAV